MGSGIEPLERWEIQQEAATLRGQASVYAFSHLSEPLYRNHLIRDLSYRIDNILHQFSTQRCPKAQALGLFRQERQNLLEQNQLLTIYGVDVITDAMVLLNHHSGYSSAQRLISVALAMPNEDPLKELDIIQPAWDSENGQRFKLFRYVAQEQLDLRNHGLGNSKMSLEEREKLAMELLNQRMIAASDPVMTPVYEEVKPKLTLKQRVEKQRQQRYAELYRDETPKATEPQWVKIRAIHNNSWQTPAYLDNLKVTINSVEHQSGVRLNAVAVQNTVSGTAKQAKETQKTEGGVAVFDNLQPDAHTIQVSFVAEPGLETQITELQDTIEARLDGLYHGLINDMAGFQEEWQQLGYSTLYVTHLNGFVEGAKAWGASVPEMFTARFWSEAADTLTEVTSSTVDKLYIHSVERFNSITEIFITEEGTLQNPTWMLTALEEQTRSLNPTGHINNVAREFAKWCIEENAVTKLKCIAKYRNEILALPGKLAEEDVNAVESFIDNILVQFSPEWAKEIKQSPNYPKALAVIEDHDAILTYLAYLSLVIEAIPPNFYSFYLGKLRAYLLLEIIMTLTLALCTLGGGAAARVGVLVAQLTAVAKKVKGASHAAKAMEGLIQTIKGFVDVLQDFEQLAGKLAKRDLGKFSGRSGTTLTMKKSQVKRDGKCRFCQSSKHNTPRLYRGEINYV